MPCKWDRVFLDWLQKRGYKTRHDGEGHIHIYRRDGEFPFWEIDIYYPGGTIIAIGRAVQQLDMADPELFSKLGELFPVRSSGVFVGGRWRGFLVRLLGSVSSLVRVLAS